MASGISLLPYTVANAPLIIEAYAVKYGIEAGPLEATLKCESGFEPKKQSNYYKNGVREESYGVGQINLPAHLDITKAEAMDPFFAIDWSASQFKAGKQNMWTCYRKLYGSQSP